MPHIPQVDLSRANPAQKAAHDEEMRLRGRMTNMKRTLLHSPTALRVYGEWFTLRDQLRPALGDRAIFAFCLAISRAMDNPVGIGFMLRALSGLHATAAPTDNTIALLERFGTAIATDPRSVPPDLWAALSDRLSHETMVDLVAFAGQMIATNVFTAAVGTEIDAELLPYLATAASGSRA